MEETPGRGLGNPAWPRRRQSLRQGEGLRHPRPRACALAGLVVDYVLAHAWPELVRMERLGIMTCQRGSDLIRMGPEHRERSGIRCRPKKTRKRRRAFHI